MPRRQQTASDDLLRQLTKKPWWVGPTLAIVVFLLLRFVPLLFIPAKQGKVDMWASWRSLPALLAWIVSGSVMLIWGMAQLTKLMNRNMLDNQSGPESIRKLSWREFERLVGEAYRRKGYVADVVASNGGDGGIDIHLTGHGEKVLVQCKQWRAYSVGVAILRELLGVVVSEKADRGIVVTSGRFTEDAVEFANQNPQIELVDGQALAELIRGVKAGPGAAPPPSPVRVSAPAAPSCPMCGAPMLLRTARKGQNAGSQFWGCSKYSVSGCRGTRQVEAARQGATA